jgi:hypothetical protein
MAMADQVSMRAMVGAAMRDRATMVRRMRMGRLIGPTLTGRHIIGPMASSIGMEQGQLYARARTNTAERSYALAPRSHLQQYARYRATSHVASTAATARPIRPVANLPSPPAIRSAGIKGAPVSRTVGVPAAAKPPRGIRSASVSEGAYR